MRLTVKKILLMMTVFLFLLMVPTVSGGQRVEAAAKNGIVKEDGKRYYYKNGKKKTGWITIKSGSDKGKYYFRPDKKGAAASGLLKISEKNYYFDKKTNKLVTDRLGIKIGSKYYKISSKGVAVKISEVEGLAGIQAEACKRKLKTAFTWSAGLTYKTMETKNEAKYAITGFKYGYGDCKVQAATFCYLARALGYEDVEYHEGYVTNKDRTVFNGHAWCTIGDKVYDPNFVNYVMKPTNGGKTKKEAIALSYGFSYGDAGHFHYCDKDKNPLE